MSEPTMNDLQCIVIANGEIHAQQVLGFLKASGIAAMARGESVRHTHGLTVGGLGAVEILVSSADADRARALLASAEAGELRRPEDEGNGLA